MKSNSLAARLLPFSLAWGLFIGACSDFASPAELSRPQILAIRSEPASLAPGQSATLSLLLANSAGPIDNAEVSWRISPGQISSPLGSLTLVEGVTTYTAPGGMLTAPTLITLEASVVHDGKTLIGVKAILIGGPLLTNPVIREITTNESAVEGPLLLARGSTNSLAVGTLDPPSSDVTYAWYASPGTIDEYRSSPTTIIAPDAPSQGWLYVVVRDRGGVAFRAVETRIE